MPSSNRESRFTLPPPLCSTQALTHLDGTPHIDEGRPSSSLSPLLIQMLISSRDILTKPPRNFVLPASGHPFNQVCWYTKFTTTMRDEILLFSVFPPEPGVIGSRIERTLFRFSISLWFDYLNGSLTCIEGPKRSLSMVSIEIKLQREGKGAFLMEAGVCHKASPSLPGLPSFSRQASYPPPGAGSGAVIA